ncbi:Hypothetical protein c0474 [Escherichia coli CFT073]|uniref:Uncharacterized protein n=1 Tax=Escherichia coli O6:H1 (strain CFT073 / ATCC 700928 / UPEC) TaxID=199310 RepID=A0A0H2V4R4_ECOL6|nr:Hypothetical protein c0474 [Escherichia coli CFT073]
MAMNCGSDLMLRLDSPATKRRAKLSGSRSSTRPGPGESRTSSVAINTASSISWVINSTCFPVSCQSFSSRVCIWSRVKASSAPNGSSSNNSWGFAANARAIPTR